MNREILFKAKRKDNGKWVEGGYFSEPYTDKKFIICWNSFGLGFNEFVEVLPETLCQYTGLTDKNGRKIWENDIVKCPKRKEEYELYRVVWRKDFADFGVEPIKPKFEAKYPMGLSKELTIYGRDYEVIGNIFDNPELLEVE